MIKMEYCWEQGHLWTNSTTSSCVAQGYIAIATESEVENKIDLWHQRLGHLNEIQLREMASHDLVKRVDIPKTTRISFCEKCVESKKLFKSVE